MQITPPFYAYSAHRRHAARARRHEGARRARGVPAPRRGRRRADRELPARRGRPPRHRMGHDLGPQPAARVLLDQRLRADRTPLAVGRPRPQLPGRRRVPALQRTRRRRAAAGAGPHRGRQRGRRHARGDGDPRRARAARTTGEGAFLDVSIADGVLGLMALAVDEYLATGEEPAPRHGLLTGRYACYDTYPTRDGRWLTVAAIEPRFWANLCELVGLPQWAAHQEDDAVQDQIRAELRAVVPHPRPRRLGRRPGPGRHVRRPVLTVPEIVADDQFLAPRRLQRRARHRPPATSGRWAPCSRAWPDRPNRTRCAT